MFENDPASRNELDFGYSIRGVGRFWVNVHVSRGSVAASVRALADRIPGLEELGLPDAILIGEMKDYETICREGKIDYEAAKPYIYEKSTHDTIKALRR